MQKIAIIPISEAGKDIAATIQSTLNAEVIQRSDVGQQWRDFDAFVFIGAMGICVRTIAPFIEDKHKDPAVVCIDSSGRNVISVLSGHVGGANELTRHLAAMLGAHEVITTQSDNMGLWALDTLADRFNWALASEDDMNECIFAFVNKKPTALLLEVRDEGTDYLEQTLPEHVTIINDIDEADPKKYQLLIMVTPFNRCAPFGMLELHFVPMVGTIGFGLASHPDDYEDIYDQIDEAFARQGVLPCAQRYCTIDVKKDEEFCAMLADDRRYLRSTVFSGKTTENKGRNMVLSGSAAEGKGHIEIVGAGPGDPDLISVRGRKMLERADLILYAGSLVPKALTECHKPGAVVRSSADMNLEEQCALMKEHYDQGHFIVRLHTGDPCIFGAIQEQMAFFDLHHMQYHITPGISSFLAAAAELQSQFTIPERCQTIILTRGEGRTPMPEKEQLHLLARSQSTMCIFLSASIVDDVQRELLMEYPEDTPVAACYHLTWPDQKIFRGVLKDLAKIVHDNQLTLTTMLVVGDAIDNRQGLSELYNKHFTHLFRKGN